MRGMSLKDDGVASREGRGCIPARDGKRQRKVASAEHCHRAEWAQHRAKVGPGCWFAVWLSAVNACPDPGTFLHNFGKQSQLAACAPRLCFETGLGQSCFLVGALD